MYLNRFTLPVLERYNKVTVLLNGILFCHPTVAVLQLCAKVVCAFPVPRKGTGKAHTIYVDDIADHADDRVRVVTQLVDSLVL